MSLFSTKIEAKWKEPAAFRRARADYERNQPISLRKRAVIVFGAMGAVAAVAFHFLGELTSHPEFRAAFCILALAVGVFYMPLRGWLLANVDAQVKLDKTHIERAAAFGLEKDKWEIKEMADYHFTTGKNCELLLIEMRDGSRVLFGVPEKMRANIQNNFRVAFKDTRNEKDEKPEPII